MNSNFFIKDVEIKNFRGYSNKKFEFFKNKEDYEEFKREFWKWSDKK